jgi:hypothetical protein
MSIELISIITAILIFLSIGGLYKYVLLSGSVKQFPRETVAQKCHLCKIRGDICYHNEYKPCPMSSYKQCTNNIYPVSKCLCKEQRSFELCEKDIQMSEACYMHHYNLKPDLNINVKYSEKYPRVNLYNIPYTPFDRFEHLRQGPNKYSDDSLNKPLLSKEGLPNPIPMEVAAANTITRAYVDARIENKGH